MKLLVIGYGNPSRNDDGVGWFVVEQLQAAGLSGVELQTAHQLEVDHADTIGKFDTVVFVDAAVPQAPERVNRTVVKPRLQGHPVAHYLTPADLLALTSSLYGQEPRAILFSVRGHDFNFGTSLSPATEHAAQNVVDEIVRLAAMLAGASPRQRRSKAAHA